ncbi:anti-sigma factor family protein [Pusillimonas sp.]|uniref:anti-sigma factor family protein n=1 Tax=Pusillimonas sp. TaxID=3040095 RepID=UPI0037C547BD
MNTNPTVTEDDLHALVDGQLEAHRLPEVEAYLRERPEQACHVAAWTIQRRQLQALFSPVMTDPIPKRLERSARQHQWPIWQAAASVLIALTSGIIGWGLHDKVTEEAQPYMVASSTATGQLVQYAAMAHDAVYAADQRRPVEITAAHEDQLVTWLSKRMAARMNPPDLQSLGYRLEGGRLLPGRLGPVAQFMYEDGSGMRLTLYVANEAAHTARQATGTNHSETTTAFQFAQDGSVNVFYWIDGPFGYAISSYGGRSELARVSAAVFRQLDPERARETSTTTQ